MFMQRFNMEMKLKFMVKSTTDHEPIDSFSEFSESDLLHTNLFYFNKKENSPHITNFEHLEVFGLFYSGSRI